LARFIGVLLAVRSLLLAVLSRNAAKSNRKHYNQYHQVNSGEETGILRAIRSGWGRMQGVGLMSPGLKEAGGGLPAR